MSILRTIASIPEKIIIACITFVIGFILYFVVCEVYNNLDKYGEEAIEFADRFAEDCEDPHMEESPLYYFNFDPETLMYLDIHEKGECIREETEDD